MSLVDKKIVSFNVNGIRDYKKRRHIFNHLHHLQADIVLLQETHCDKKVEKLWKSEWGGSIFFSHGESNARGVAILFGRKFKCKVIKMARDLEGRVLAVAVEVNTRKYVLSVLYAPNSDKPDFFVSAFSLVFSLGIDLKIIGGDMNTVLDLEKDILGGRGCSNSKTWDFLNAFLLENELKDIWRFQHPEDFRSTFIRRKPVQLLERLDYFFVSSALVQNVRSSDILPMFVSDHAIPVIKIDFIDSRPGRGYWKFNNSLLTDDEFKKQVVDAILQVHTNFKDQDHRSRWEMIKMAIRDKAIERGICLARSRKNKIQALERALLNNVKARDEESKEVLLDLFDDYDSHIQGIQAELEELTLFRAQGAILRSRANWIELGERNNAYFLNLEKHNFNKKTITQLREQSTDSIVSDPTEILRILNRYFSNLYKEKDLELDLDYLGTINFPQISERDKYMLDGPIQLEEIHIALKQLKKNKCPGTDGLTPELYLHFWPYLAKNFKLLFSEIVDNKLLHSSARDGILTLLGKLDKDPLLVPNWRPITLLNTDYKLFAKVLANRLLHVLPQLVGDDQFGYIKGRSISDNLLDLFSIIQHWSGDARARLEKDVFFCSDFSSENFKRKFSES